jgi:hypothetical protein
LGAFWRRFVYLPFWRSFCTDCFSAVSVPAVLAEFFVPTVSVKFFVPFLDFWAKKLLKHLYLSKSDLHKTLIICFM